jgi:hypothetical protein
MLDVEQYEPDALPVPDLTSVPTESEAFTLPSVRQRGVIWVHNRWPHGRRSGPRIGGYSAPIEAAGRMHDRRE